MAGEKIWTAAELERLSPDERASIVKAGLTTDLSKASPELLNRARRKAERRIAMTEGSQASP